MWGRALCALIFFRQHDRQHAGDDWVSICALDMRLLIQIKHIPMAPSPIHNRFTMFLSFTKCFSLP